MSGKKESLPRTTISILASSSSTEPSGLKTSNIKLNSDPRPADDVVKSETVTLTHKQRVTKKNEKSINTDNLLKLETTCTTAITTTSVNISR